MRLEEYDLHFPKSGDHFHAVNRAGEILATYQRHRPPLYDMWERDGITTKMYAAGIRFGDIYRASGLDPWQRAPHSDTTRIVVDGAGRAPDALGGSDGAKLMLCRIESELGWDTYNILAAICGMELSARRYAVTARLDRRAVKKRLREALAWLSKWFERH